MSTKQGWVRLDALEEGERFLAPAGESNPYSTMVQYLAKSLNLQNYTGSVDGKEKK
jgi:hypothetical protein